MVFLKKIVLHGFKSFADRTEFEFGEGITGIVGPNGCGKSNILDAVRWVLGEQSARSLRGGKMADVIFAGSRSRKPAPFAEVVLTFDNRARVLHSEHDEVTVGRVLYAGGASEYRLNGSVCRLKDVRDLLLDTGIGVDAYSVIEQGRVDRLLQADPVERREIFEEAAGISRYKVRRAEAQRKLERTRENLTRLQDILDELERRVRSVKLAAGKARSFQEYDARLRELRSAFSLAEYHELEQTRRAAQSQADELAAALAADRDALAAAQAGADEQQAALLTLEQALEMAEHELQGLQSELSALVERLAQGERRRTELQALGARRAAQAEEFARQAAALRAEAAAEEVAQARFAAAEQAGADRIAAVQGERDAAQARADEIRRALEREKTAAFEAVRRAALLQNEQANLTQQRQRLSAQAERHVRRQADLGLAQAAARARAAEVAARLGALETRVAGLADALRGDEERLAALADEAAQIEAALGAAREARSALQSRLALLEDLERRLEGVDAGTRAVLAWRDEGGGDAPVLGLVADLIRIDDPRLAVLQPVLATFENHVVVRDLAAFLAWRAARGSLAGPVRMLSAARLAERPALLSYVGVPGVVARALDWVTVAPEHRALAEHLLGRTVVVETLERALALAAKAPPGYVFVTLDGHAVGADGRLVYGAAAGAAGLISRKAEIRQLRGELAEVERRVAGLSRQRAALEAASSDVQLQRQGRLQEIATLQREEVELRGERARLGEESERLQRESGVVGGELHAVQRALDELAAQLAELTEQAAAVGAAQQAHDTRVGELADELAAVEAVLGDLARQYTAAVVARERAAEQRAAAERALRELRARVAAAEREQAEAAAEAAAAEREVAAAEAELAAARERLATGQAEAAAREAALAVQRGRRQELRAGQAERARALAGLRAQIEQREAAWHEAQLALRETAVRMEALVARVRDELGLDLAERYAGYAAAEQDWAAVRAEIEELRGKIARLGNVNLDALTELAELTPRYERLTAQRQDLLKSIGQLEALIAQLDEESRTRFAAAFEEVRSHFQELFRKLFGGGKADVFLEDPARPLECGIEIVARPPGKEPQSISLLSGGEKTMTAVALLMAVLRSRPSPFAILDEVDAALDESNVDCFNTLLIEFLSVSQFVVITHNKRTMACCDRLYGITMEEPGVSKRVSVRFEERVNTPSVA